MFALTCSRMQRVVAKQWGELHHMINVIEACTLCNWPGKTASVACVDMQASITFVANNSLQISIQSTYSRQTVMRDTQAVKFDLVSLVCSLSNNQQTPNLC